MRFAYTCFAGIMLSFAYAMGFIGPFPYVPSSVGWLMMVIFVILIVASIFWGALKAQDEEREKRERTKAMRAGCRL